jgi:AraC family transcriptional regulator
MRVLAHGAGWRVSDVRCTRGPQDRPFEEQHAGFSIAVVLAGTFHYRSSPGRALLYPGAILLGNDRACFECGHEHGHGDRCLALSFSPEVFAQIAGDSVADARFRLRAPMLPASRALARPIARLQARLRADRGAGVEEAALLLAESVVRSVAESPRSDAALSALDQRRLSAVVRHIEAHAHEALDLTQLAALAGMSRFHFLRCFRRAFGLTPHQHLLLQRLQRAVGALRDGHGSIARIALDAGFGDVSSFNALFRSVYGCTPRAFRRDAGDATQQRAPAAS